MTKIEIEQNSKASKICKEFALDFKQRQMPNDVNYWDSLSEIYKRGGTISEAEINQLIAEIDARLQAAKMAASGELGDDKYIVSLVEIGNEALLLNETIRHYRVQR
ncbi:MAG: hypothetical protein GX782_11490 [Gammaproteobacteria bacterium]|nr:hypothetical protein [Gammaproteobacteria bacterium]